MENFVKWIGSKILQFIALLLVIFVAMNLFGWGLSGISIGPAQFSPPTSVSGNQPQSDLNATAISLIIQQTSVAAMQETSVALQQPQPTQSIATALSALVAPEIQPPAFILDTPIITDTPLPSSYVDEFNTPNLDSIWYWINEDPSHWSLVSQPGWLQIFTQAGEIWQGNNINISNILLRNLSYSPSSNFEIITKLAFTPTTNWQSAGLVIYNNDDDYATLFYGYHTDFGGKNVRFQSEEGGTGQQTGVALSASPSIIYLKITKTNNSYAGYFSIDNFTWTKVGEYINQMNALSVGIITNNGTGITQAAQATFDYFQLIK